MLLDTLFANYNSTLLYSVYSDVALGVSIVLRCWLKIAAFIILHFKCRISPNT